MSDASSGKVFVEELLQRVVTWHLVLLAAFFVQAHPTAPSLGEVIPDVHLQHRTDAADRIAHRGTHWRPRVMIEINSHSYSG